MGRPLGHVEVAPRTAIVLFSAGGANGLHNVDVPAFGLVASKTCFETLDIVQKVVIGVGSAVTAGHQYQFLATKWSHAPQGEPYLASMYPTPQRICVSGLVAQSAPAEAIFSAGRDWGIP
jgi:hypothetical protein